MVGKRDRQEIVLADDWAKLMECLGDLGKACRTTLAEHLITGAHCRTRVLAVRAIGTW